MGSLNAALNVAVLPATTVRFSGWVVTLSGPLLWVPIQRFVLRWLLYYVLFATFIMAIKGFRVGWGKLERKGSVLGPRGVPRA